MRLSDAIEEFIKTMLSQEELEIELKRNELAEYFRCAPSQINYVLSTRFTPDHGYVTESRRGGGGCIRIIRLEREQGQYLQYLLDERIGDSITTKSAQILCMQLAEQGAVSEGTARLMCAALSPKALSVPIPEPLKDALRAKMMRSMLTTVAKNNNRLESEG
ncbi:MAG: CtsR family transcriptional regulator [Christensenellales bacterium]|jgi:transcriptional regulator CtsR